MVSLGDGVGVYRDHGKLPSDRCVGVGFALVGLGGGGESGGEVVMKSGG